MGEGVLWHVGRQSVWWVDILKKRCFEAALSGTATRAIEMPQSVSALMPATDSEIVAALHDGFYRLDPENGNIRAIGPKPQIDAARFRMNDAKCDPQGRIVGGTTALDDSRGQCFLYRLELDGTLRQILSGASISNGLAWSADGRLFYYIDSPRRCVQVFAYDSGPSPLGAPERLIDLSQIPGLPDGCTLDCRGRLWIAHWGGWCVTAWDPFTGVQFEQLELPVSQVTNCTFGGKELNELFITTASIGLSPAQRAIEPEAGNLFRAKGVGQGIPAALCARPSRKP